MSEQRFIVNITDWDKNGYFYVDEDGTLHDVSSKKRILVRGVDELRMVSERYNFAVGTIAFTAGWNDIWQKNPDGEWVMMRG